MQRQSCGLRAHWFGSISLAMATLASIGFAQTQQELDAKSGGGPLARMWRTEACQDAKEPSRPSIAHNGKGELLLMFTCKEAKTELQISPFASVSDC